MRLADYAIQFLEERGIGHAFTVVGGGSIFLCDALAKAERMRYVCTHHEQAAAMAAEGYARARTGLGLTVVTSGPGGTNAITGVAGAWTDHVPTITLSGQVFRNQMIDRHPGLRTLGVQEINIADIVRPITKYSAVVRRPEQIRYHLERAVRAANTGRPGPVWLDIPADVQNAKIDEAGLAGYERPMPDDAKPVLNTDHVAAVIEVLRHAKRPLVHVGQGVRLAGAEAALFEFLEAARVPVLTARNGNDLIDSGHPLYVGRPGTFAQRGANFAVQTCDFYLAIGTRLSLAQTGYNAKDYARRAVVAMVDIEQAELNKGTLHVDLGVHADALDFLTDLSRQAPKAWPDWSPWLERCKGWLEKYPPVTDAQRTQERFVNSYHLIDELSDWLRPDDTVVTDMGFAFQNTHQAFRVTKGQRLFTNCGLAAMGWGLPAAIGAAVATGRRTVCIAGDGGLMMNAQELATVKHYGLPIKLFVLNNGGYLTMRQSQAHAFDAYMGSDADSGLSFPDFKKLSEAHALPFRRLETSGQMLDAMEHELQYPGPSVLEVMMDPEQAQIPKSINRRLEDGTIQQTALEDAWPYLPREEIEGNLKI